MQLNYDGWRRGGNDARVLYNTWARLFGPGTGSVSKHQ